MNTNLTTTDIPDVLKELEEAFFDIPFENSAFQNRAFVVAAQQTPARAFRAVGLRMFSKIQAVKEHLYNKELAEINLEEKREKLQSPDIDKFEKRRIELEIRKIQDGEGYANKLFNDALRDLDCMYAEFKRLPKYTREQFEAEEEKHFEQRLTRQLSAGGAQESLLNMRQDLPQLGERIEAAIAEIKQQALPAPAADPQPAPKGLPPAFPVH